MATSDRLEHIPIDVVETILSRLPTKDILKFKAVSKAWNEATLDPKLARIHLHCTYYNTNDDDNNLFMWLSNDTGRYHLGKFNGYELDFMSWLQFPDKTTTTCPPSPPYAISGSCDGFFLLSDTCEGSYVLWNPLTGSNKSFAMHPNGTEHRHHELAHGICYDSLSDDYKVVCVAPKWYAVFSCRGGSWTERKVFPYKGTKTKAGVTVRGVSYWVVFNVRGLGRTRNRMIFHAHYPETCYHLRHKIVYFDAAECGFKTLQQPKEVRETDVVHLTNLNGRLCLYQKWDDCRHLKIWVLMQEENNASWTKLTDAYDLPRLGNYCTHLKPLHLTEDLSRIVIQVLRSQGRPIFVDYDIRKRISERVWMVDDDMHSEVVSGLGSLVFPTLENHSC